MHVQEWHAQDRASGAIGRTLDGIASLAGLPYYSQIRAAVAYATLNGCRVLVRRVAGSPRWTRSRKRWLISIDFGRTEPAALDFLAALPRAEVRIPFGAQVVARRGFSPITPFHPKAYAVDDIGDGGNRVFGVFLGSGNLTGSGLLTGSESGALSYWVDPTRAQKKGMASAYDHMSWFEAVWERADPLRDILLPYKKRWKKSKPPIKEEDPEIVDLYVGGTGRVVSGTTAIGLASARALWVEVGELYKNRGPGQAGNQVDLPRGSRVFFGFPPSAVPRNTIFGHVYLVNAGFDPVRCSVRFGNNQMDKVNLPVPGTEGPPSYDNCILLFERVGLADDRTPIFGVGVGDEAQLAEWKRSSTSDMEMRMQSGRRYGLLF